ncbi:TetR family transcriptional regulator [Pseudomonas monteilii]|uniref:TetR family transcriptional regulator n=1 Tax=Pseudomonas monteilii TaxID=76759 RepID=A0A7X3JQQ2_9PSED|nr:TetR family transcriptional regulator [Pseudomonas monteilii]MVF49039.1 TetR family transcriptional regulator [Pseudomonas monteilii]
MTSKKTRSNYKPAEDREKELKLALIRIQKGRTRTGEAKVTIAAVAREAGVSTALIHNHYPKILEAIREAQGRSSRAKRDAKHQELTSERRKSAAYRQEIEELRAKVFRLASINEVLLEEIRALKAVMTGSKVAEFPIRKRQN